MKKKIRYGVQIIFFIAFVWLMINQKMNIWLMIFAASLGAAVLFGRIFCGWICPMNTIMTPIEWISKKLGIQSKKVPEIFRSKKLGYLLLIILVAAAIISKKNGLNLPFLVYLMGISGVFTLKYEGSIWHSNLCPFGVLQNIPGRFSKLTTRIDYDKCVGCKFCTKNCPGEAIEIDSYNKKASIDSSKCLQCSNCETECPTEAIDYGKSFKTIKKFSTN